MKKQILALLLAVLVLTGCAAPSTEEITNQQLTLAAETNVISNVEEASVFVPEATEADPAAEPSETAPLPPEESTFSIHFIDVGQADAALVECDGEYLLIDGGNKEDSQILYTVLKNKNIDHLKMVVGTHGHEDHIGGLPGAFAYASADMTLCPVTTYDSNAFEDFAEAANKHGGGITVPVVGDTYSLGSAAITILGVNSTEETNDTSIVLRMDYGTTSFLFTGDAEWDAEQTILSTGANLSATVLKVGHHGSDTSTGYQFLRAVAPQHAVISVGTGNEYGHPTEDVLSRLRDADVTVYRTDMQGDIYCTSDGQTVSFRVAKNADADTLSNAGAGGNHEPVTIPPTEEAPVTEGAEAESSMAAYIVNTNTGKFHYPSCSSVDQMSDKNKLEVTESRDALVSQGYDPCGRCHP